MKKYKAILFDMDGTLVPMVMKEFTDGYFRLLAKKLAKHGIAPADLVDAVWTGTGAMVKNDGRVTNDVAFWKTFEHKCGFSRDQVGGDCDEFYENEFIAAKIFTGDNPLAQSAIEAARDCADKVILASNPLFPLSGQATRLKWVGLEPKDFDLVTSYESDKYCKPNPKYYEDICNRIDVQPGECLMIGNDELEDMYAASNAGMDCYLVTDCVIPSSEHPWEGPKGTFSEMVEMLKSL